MKGRAIGASLPRKRGLKQGESSSSNPNVTSHRDAVKEYRKKHLHGMTFNSAIRPVQKSTSMMSLASRPSTAVVDDDSISNSVLAAPTAIVLGLQPQKPTLQRYINAALESCDEILRERLSNDMSESTSAYFLSLFPLLESCRGMAESLSAEKREDAKMEVVLRIVAIVYPMSAIIRKVPEPVLQKHWSSLVKLVHQIIPIVNEAIADNQQMDSDSDLEDCDESDSTNANSFLLLRSLLQILSRLLVVRVSNKGSSTDDWHYPNGISAHLFATLFHYTFHFKPRVRRLAHSAIVKVVSSSKLEMPSQQLFDLLFTTAKKFSSGSDSNETRLRRCLALTRDTISYMPPSRVKTFAELLLTVSLLLGL